MAIGNNYEKSRETTKRIKMQAEEIKSKILVYNIEPFNSIGIYIGESKEEALKSITSEIWDIRPLEMLWRNILLS